MRFGDNFRLVASLSTLLVSVSSCKKKEDAPSCAKSTAAPIVLRVGALTPVSGSSANTSWITALRLAVDQMNSALECNPNSKGISFEMIEHDDGNQPVNVPGLVQDLKSKGVLTLFSNSSAVTATANGMNYDASAPLGIPIVCAPCTTAQFNDPKPATFPTFPSPKPAITEDQWKMAYTDLDKWLFRTTTTTMPGINLSLASRVILKRGANGNGDIDGNGKIKLGVFSGANNNCNFDAWVSSMTDKTMFHCEYIKAPADLDDPSAFDFSKAASAMFDNANTSPVGTPFPPSLNNDSNFKSVYSEYFTFDSTKNTVVTKALMPEDGVPDYVFSLPAPVHQQGFLTAYYRQGYNKLYPNVQIITYNSFVRASALQMFGDLAEGIEGVVQQLYRDDDSGKTFAKAFEETAGVQVAGFDASVYDSMVVSLIAILEAALPLENPSTVTSAQVRDALEKINEADGEIVRTGVSEFSKTIDLISQGAKINYEGASGPVDFDEVGNVIANMEYYKVVGGRWTTQYVFDCVSDKYNCPMRTAQ